MTFPDLHQEFSFDPSGKTISNHFIQQLAIIAFLSMLEEYFFCNILSQFNPRPLSPKGDETSLAHVKKQVADLSIGIAQTVVKKELASQDDQLKLVEGMLEDVTLN